MAATRAARPCGLPAPCARFPVDVNASAAPAVHAAQPSRLTTRPDPRAAWPETASPRSAMNSPNVTALSPSPNSAPSRAALPGRATLSATSAAVTIQPIT